MPTNFEHIETKIAASPRARFGTGVPEEIIADAEAVLRARFPDSYRWWLGRYGAGYLGGYELQGLAPVPLNERAPGELFVGDLVSTWHINCQEGVPPHLVEILNLDGDEIYFLDLSQISAGEAVVVCSQPGVAETEPAYSSFAEFLLAQL